MLILDNEKSQNFINLACNVRIRKNSKINPKKQKEGNNRYKNRNSLSKKYTRESINKTKSWFFENINSQTCGKEKIE